MRNSSEYFQNTKFYPSLFLLLLAKIRVPAFVNFLKFKSTEKRKYKTSILKVHGYIILFFIATASIAQIPPGQWECFAFDSKKQNYEGLGETMQQAMNAAEANCKQRAKQRGCKTAQSFCEQGPLSLIEDRCLVSDNNGRSWNATGLNACQTALNLCNEWQFLHGRMSPCIVKHR